MTAKASDSAFGSADRAHQAGNESTELTGLRVRKDPAFCGLFVVINGNAPARIWAVKRNTAGQIIEIRHRKKWSYVKHYRFTSWIANGACDTPSAAIPRSVRKLS